MHHHYSTPQPEHITPTTYPQYNKQNKKAHHKSPAHLSKPELRPSPPHHTPQTLTPNRGTTSIQSMRSLKKAARKKKSPCSDLMFVRHLGVSIVENKVSPTNVAAIHRNLAPTWILGQNVDFFTSFVYVANIATDRQLLWDDLIHHAHLFSNSPWLLMGDFNVIPNIRETHGGSMRWSNAMTDFNDYLQETELEDLKFNGILYSWSNKSLGNACIAKKLDRALVNLRWTETFPLSECTFLPPNISDHSPILVTLDLSTPRRHIPFRFFNAWSLHPNFHPSVYAVWTKYIKGTAMFQVVQKQKLLKHVLRSNCKKEFSEVESKLQAVRLELSVYQMDLDNTPGDHNLRQLEKTLTTELLRLDDIHEDILRQKSRMSWLRLGDCNSTQLPIHFHHFLDEPPSHIDIQNCMLNLNTSKAPGLDGYNALFYHKVWDIVRRSITLAIVEFFRNGKLLGEVNNTYNCLVPKCQNPTSLHDYRPISCVNTIYKCIAKLLSMKLQQTLPVIIDPSQSAFIHGRKITLLILLTHELLREYHK
ncbi:uncharacterized protein LOC132270337 [Cornus florida]|uniref:uncharacterized protein LOC132270337 n=1 Tax=Cornus florida TaxID=4283 RepID=UPI0028A1F2F9|nr:uncharacterized protein LOC132270337 [Cornus florida]